MTQSPNPIHQPEAMAPAAPACPFYCAQPCQHTMPMLAAPVAAVGEAAARVLDVDEHETVDVGFIDWVGGKALKQGTLLYAAPQPRSSPLTEAQVANIRGLQGTGIHWRLYLETVRAIEAAHGIRGEHV